MVLRVLILFLISILGGCLSAQEIDLGHVEVFNEKGEALSFLTAFNDNESFVVVNSVFCVGCAEYYAGSCKSHKVLVILDDFSIASISNFQTVKGAELFFLSRKDSIVLNFGTIGIAQKSDGTIRLIDEKKLDQLSENYRLKNKEVRKRIDLFFKMEQ